MQERERSLQVRGALPKEEGDVVREFYAMHEENFLSSWLREDLVGKEERRKEVDEKITEGESKKRGKEKGKRGIEMEKEDNETGTVKRRCEGFVSVEAFEHSSQGGDLERCGDLSWEDPLDEFNSWSGCEPDSRAECAWRLM